ncbi:MAG: 16S rRNA (adenine(1518)-N(6)/adenine(1519)-N(6))-dimethyltransferase RsmA [Mollicutes bacterium]|nr:16S rRNA (adenine(1518)-N(6)/adenine(1519)-N(6))-dimethyltransferase RsmA [Mollicutes bacterium]
MKFNYKKSLGQNFLKDKNIIKKIADSINPTEEDLIIEIGPGAGALTKELVKKKSEVICFEIDTRLKEILEEINSEKLTIIFKDFLSIKINEYIDQNKYKNLYFVGNLPYYITTAIINKIVKESNPYEITIMVQKEVADRFSAKPGTKDYSSISIFLQYNFDIERVCNVSKTCFEPVPKVDSSVIKFKRNKKISANDEEKFYKLIKDSFTQKRKNLRNNLKGYDLNKIQAILKKYDKDLTARAEQLSIEEFVDISNNI